MYAYIDINFYIFPSKIAASRGKKAKKPFQK